MATHVKRIVNIRADEGRPSKSCAELTFRGARQNGLGTQVILTDPTGKKTDSYSFHSCYDDELDPNSVSPLHEDIATYLGANALNRCYGTAVMVFGYKDTGKHYTLVGTEEKQGLVVTTVSYLLGTFSRAEYSGTRRNLFFSMYELRNGQFFDLLATNFKAKTGPLGIQPMTMLPIKSITDARKALRLGLGAQSAIARTHGHPHAHMIMTLTLDSIKPDGELSSCSIDFYLLADAQSYVDPVLSQSEAEGLATSFHALAQCLNAITAERGDVPWESSPLTKILQRAYETGRYRMILHCTLSRRMEHYEESRRSLSYVSRGQFIPESLHPAAPPGPADEVAIKREFTALYQYVTKLTHVLENIDQGAYPPGLKTAVKACALTPDSETPDRRYVELTSRISQLEQFLERAALFHDMQAHQAAEHLMTDPDTGAILPGQSTGAGKKVRSPKGPVGLGESPAVEEKQPAIRGNAPHGKHSAARRKSRVPNCLLVEDLRVSQQIAEKALSAGADGYKVLVAASGEDAVEKYKDNHDTLKLVLMDIGLPGITGEEATKRIRAYEEANDLEPCIILGLTANVEEADLASYEAAGLNGCILKGKLLVHAVKEAREALAQKKATFIDLTKRADDSSPKSPSAEALRSPTFEPLSIDNLLASPLPPLQDGADGGARSLLSNKQKSPDGGGPPVVIAPKSNKKETPAKKLVLKEKVRGPLFGPAAAQAKEASPQVEEEVKGGSSSPPEPLAPVVQPQQATSPVKPPRSSGSSPSKGASSASRGSVSGGGSRRTGRPPDLLLVEDVTISQKVAERALSSGPDNYKVCVASDGESAVETFKCHMEHLKIVLMDIGLPGMSGVEATQQIRAYEQSKDAEPCIVLGLTANVDQENLDLYAQAGMNGCIMKGQVLAATLRDAVARLTENPNQFVNLCTS